MVTSGKANPFRPAPGSRPPALEGREADQSAVRAALDLTRTGGAAQPIFFTGLRGMGKTSLLRQCYRDAEQLGAIVLSGESGEDLPLAQAFRRSIERAQRELRDLPARLRDGLNNALAALPRARYDLPHNAGSIEIEPSERSSTAEIVDTLDQLNRLAWDHDRFLVVGIDEVQEAPVRELRPVVSFIHETAGTSRPVLMLGAGLPATGAHLLEVRTYTERWRKFTLGLLTDQQTRAAISLPLHQRGVAIEPAALEALVHASGGYPFFIQEFGSAAWARHADSIVTAADVEAVIPGVQLGLEHDLYEERFRRLTPREVRYVLTLVELGERGPHTVGEIAARLGGTSDQFSSTRTRLVQKEVLVSAGPGMVEFRVPLSRAYVLRHLSEFERRAGALGEV